MATVYYADAVTRIFAGSHSAPDGYELKGNESFDNPSGLQDPVKLTPTGWIAATDEEHKAYLEAHQKEWLAQNPMATQPADDKRTEALGALGKQVGQLVIDNQKNTKAVQALGAQLASFIAKDNANGGK